MNRGISLDHEQSRHRHAAGLGHPRKVVAQQIDDHQILGSLLGIGGKFFGEEPVLRQIGIARGGPLHRPGIERSRPQREKLFGRQRHERPAGMAHDSAPPGPRTFPQPRIKRQRRPADRHIAAERQICLVIISREEPLANFRGSLEISLARNPRPNLAGNGPRRIGQRRRVDQFIPLEQPEPQQRPVPDPRARLELRIERLPRLIGQIPRRMSAPAHRRAQRRQRRPHFVERRRNNLPDRRTIQPRLLGTAARIIEQNVAFPHRRAIAPLRSPP